MPLEKQKKDLKIAVLVPAYKRPEYTEKCIESIRQAQGYENTVFMLVDDGSKDGTDAILMSSGLEASVQVNDEPVGLRNVVIDFLYQFRDCDILGKIDNDCKVPANWLNDIIDVFSRTDADILSPNVRPSDAAMKYGKPDDGRGYRPAEIVGGLWFLKGELIRDMYFERHPTSGLTGSIPILRQIVSENDPNIGWIENVVVEDMGHWSGKHPEHIKSLEHELYSKEVGRAIAWAS